MPKNKSGHNKRDKNSSTTERETGDKNFNQFLVRTQKTLLARDEDKRCYLVSIPFQSTSERLSSIEETLDVTQNLMKRLQTKVNNNRAYLANPIVEGEGERP